MQRLQQFSAFSLLTKNSVKCSTCVVSRNNAIECGIALSEIRLFLEKHSIEFHKIWHENTCGSNWSIETNLNFNKAKEILDIPVNLQQRIIKHLSAKLLLK